MIEQRESQEVPRRKSPAEELLQRDLSSLGGQARLDDDLGFSSLDRIELLSDIEERLGEWIDEDRFSSVETGGELETLLKQPAAQPIEQSFSGLPRPVIEPRWTRSLLVRTLRKTFLSVVVLPMQRK
jgi:acyl carrier protein